MVQEKEAKISSMARKSLLGATKGTSYMGLTSGAAMAKESGLVYSHIALVKKIL